MCSKNSFTIETQTNTEYNNSNRINISYKEYYCENSSENNIIKKQIFRMLFNFAQNRENNLKFIFIKMLNFA